MPSAYKCRYYMCCLFALIGACAMQAIIEPTARFTFNGGKDYDEVGKHKARLVNANFTEDRFGNNDHAVFLSGDIQSYINLGNYAALKPQTGSVSLWVKIYEKVWSGRGHYVNPVIVTKGRPEDDFYEAYAIYYSLYSDKISTCATRDSLRQISICSSKEFGRYEWHHLAIAYDDAWFTFYIDGKKEAKVLKGFKTVFLPGDSVMVGGSGNKKNSRYLMASVDDIFFYDKVLTDQEIQELYRAPNPNKANVIFIWFSCASGLLALVAALYFFIKYRIRVAVKQTQARLELDHKLLETELKVNRASMNPHFLFNSLNALHNFILAEETENASNYLVRFSKLIRTILESNMHDSISLKLEIEILESYLQIENMRFEENIEYAFIVDRSLTPTSVHIPIMMLQPFVENAVWHGLLNKEGSKRLTISFSLLDGKYVYCIIDDNGVGRREPSGNKRSLATGFIEQRLQLLNKIHNLHCTLAIEDKPNGSGTIVRITLPVLKA